MRHFFSIRSSVEACGGKEALTTRIEGAKSRMTWPHGMVI